MAQFIVKGAVKYNGTLYASGSVVEVADKDVEEFKNNGWELVKGGKQKQKEEGEEDKDLSKLTNDQLKALCDEKGIEYDAKAKKADLLALLQA